MSENVTDIDPTMPPSGTGWSFEPGEEWFYDFRSAEFVDGPSLAVPTSHPVNQPVPGLAGAVPADWQRHLN
jgi:hypothetical protein